MIPDMNDIRIVVMIGMINGTIGMTKVAMVIVMTIAGHAMMIATTTVGIGADMITIGAPFGTIVVGTRNIAIATATIAVKAIAGNRDIGPAAIARPGLTRHLV
jgi:hypothetical protein